MESSRKTPRKQRCAKSRPDARFNFEFIDVKPNDQNQKKKTRTIVRANAAHFHWRHNRPPQDNVKTKLSDHAITSLQDNESPSLLLPMDSTHIGNDFDPFASYNFNLPRAIVSHCIAFNARYIIPALFPDEANHFQVVSNLLQMTASNNYLVHMFLMGTLSDSRGNLGLTPSSRVALDIFRSRADIIRKLSIAMKDPTEACKDMNVLAIVALTKTVPSQTVELPPRTPKQGPLKGLQLLDSFSLQDIDPVHVNGLVKLIELKGGLEDIKIPGLAPIISLGDILGSSRYCSAPRFSIVTLSCPTRDFVFQSQGMPGFGADLDLYIVTSMLREYTLMIDNHCEGRQFFTSSTLIDHRNTTQHALLSLPPRLGTSECYRLAALIYSLLVTFPLPYRVAPFGLLVKQLMKALADWDGEDDMLLWVLTLGGVGATGLDERLWFISNLEVTANRTALKSWSEARYIMTKGLWHGPTNDGDGRDLWRESGMIE